MVSKAHRHPVVLHTPFYAAQGEGGSLLHRYLDDQFLPKFLDDLERGNNASLQATQEWRSEDRFSRHDKLPLLRLPIHRCFYLLSCEVACDQPGLPALDVKKINSAGFVIRRGKPDAKEQIWKLRANQAQGWQALQKSAERTEPDEYRYLLNQGLIQARNLQPPYSGEEIYPLHATTVKYEGRSRTILYGYVPLGGTLNLPINLTGDDNDESPDLATLQTELFWPFGTAQYAYTTTSDNGLPEIKGKESEAPWTHSTGLQVSSGKPTVALLDLIKVLVNRYRIGDTASQPGTTESEALETLLGRIPFLSRQPLFPDDRENPIDLSGISKNPVDLSGIPKEGNLLDYLKNERQALMSWIPKASLNSPVMPTEWLNEALPNAPGQYLYIQEKQAEALRRVLATRLKNTLQQQVADLPVPRYRQRHNDIYFAKVFVRHDDPGGCETLTWGPASGLFRVAAPFDPEASRPQLIQLPDLDDLKRGVAKGVAFLTPKKLAEQIEAINPDMESGSKPGPGKFGLEWIYSFSIPVVTICAMILLMIIVNLLDIILRWMPWVIVRIPILKGFKKDLP